MIILNRLSDGNFISSNRRWMFRRYELGWNVTDTLTGEWFNAVSIQEASKKAEELELDNIIELDTIG